MANFFAKFTILIQYLVPQHFLSRLIGRLASCQKPWLKDCFIRWFIKRYNVNMEEALESDPQNYPDFNSFFTRALRPDARALAQQLTDILCPVDGCISQIGQLNQQTLLQAKGHDFLLTDLLGGDAQRAIIFQNGHFATLYLAPKDYHRVHMPLDGQLIHMTYVPGRLFSVNQQTAQSVPKLFARNERVICYFNTPAGAMAVILVGAMIVASIETVWAGTIAPSSRRTIQQWNYQEQAINLARGAELGRFKLGSTALILFSDGHAQWDEAMSPNNTVRLGQKLGVWR